jgi:hypothetical protein
LRGGKLPPPNPEAELPYNRDHSGSAGCAQWGCGGGTPRQSGGPRLTAPPNTPPPFPLPDGPNGEKNYWKPNGDTHDLPMGPRWEPRYPVPSPKGGQPEAWWDPEGTGKWSYEPGDGSPRWHADRWGNRINAQAVAKAATVVAGAVVLYRTYRAVRILVFVAEAAAAF